MAFRIHVHRDLTGSDLKNIASFLSKDGAVIDFNKFCCIVADFRQKKQKHSVEEIATTASAAASATASTASSPSSPGHEKPAEKRSKRKRVKNFFSKVFHRNVSVHGHQEGPSLLSNANSYGSAEQRGLENSSTSHSGGGVEQPRVSQSPLLRDINSATTGGCGTTKPGALLNRRGSSVRDVYLGGSANGSWRKDVAVPMLKKHGLTYFNPQCVTRRLMPMWAAAIDNSRVLLFVILGNSRSLAAMNEAAFYIGQSQEGPSVVLVVQSIPADTNITADAYSGSLSSQNPGEVLTKQALKDYNRGRSYLSDIANREGVPVFDNVTEAVQCVVDKCKTVAGQK